jgi:hypothetical protein
MSTNQSYLPVSRDEPRITALAPVGFAHRNAPVVFMGGSPRHAILDSGPQLRFEGRVSRATRFPVEAAIAMNAPRGQRLGHHVDMHC